MWDLESYSLREMDGVCWTQCAGLGWAVPMYRFFTMSLGVWGMGEEGWVMGMGVGGWVGEYVCTPLLSWKVY